MTGQTEVDIKRGLAGVIVDDTSVSQVMPESNSLTYRGYPVQELCANKSFEENLGRIQAKRRRESKHCRSGYREHT